jgi:hypothetical protein
MSVPLWEWSVVEGPRHGSVGISGSRHRAMDTLSQTMAAGEGFSTGEVVPLALVDGFQPRSTCGAFPNAWPSAGTG